MLSNGTYRLENGRTAHLEFKWWVNWLVMPTVRLVYYVTGLHIPDSWYHLIQKYGVKVTLKD